MDGEGRGQGKVVFTPPSPAFSLFLTAWYKFLSLPSLLLPLKSKIAAIIFAKKILSTHLPKLNLFSGLS